MYLHVGNNKSIRKRAIIGIFDTDNSTVSTITRKFLSDSQKRGVVSSANDEIPKSFVLYIDRDGEIKICFSQLSSSALYGRLDGSLENN